ncbi:MAG: nucleotidyltransferase family protein [Proteobacteria bacterium]|nr:nucleotidyltransferase family protein [Pseudomonadota bacterium]
MVHADEIIALPEFRLLTACLIWPHDEACAQGVRQAAADVGDWSLFARMARRHRIAGLVQDALRRAGVEPAPDAAADLVQQAGVIARRNLASVAESTRLRRLFEKAGIDVLFLKGVALGMQIYSSPTPRHSKDIDLLVTREKVVEACDLLARNGYRRVLPRKDSSEAEMALWFRDHKDFVLHGAFEIELHWRLFNNDAVLGHFDRKAAGVPVVLGDGLSLETFDRELQFVYLCAHGARDAWFRLKWLADIRALLARTDAAEIERLYRRAQALRAGRAAAQALLLCERLLRLPLPAALKNELEDDWRVRWLVRIAVQSLAGDAEREPVEMPFGTTRIELSRWLLGQGFAYWGQEARLTLGWRDPKAAKLPWLLRMLYPFWRPVRWLYSQAFRKSDPRRGPA